MYQLSSNTPLKPGSSLGVTKPYGSEKDFTEHEMSSIIIIIMNKFSIALFPVETSSTRLITNVQRMSENGSMLPH